GRIHMHEHDHDDGGLAQDLKLLGASMERRTLLRFDRGASVLSLMGCCGSDSGTGTTGDGSCSKIPTETAGPYPGDGSNGPNVLNQTGGVRSDNRSSFAGLSWTALGVP